MKPKGKYEINVCLGTACYVKGAKKVVEYFEEELGIKLGETTSDRLFTLSSARCFGACGLAPAVMVNDEVYGNVDRKKVKEIIKKKREEINKR
jgi:NADH:ubiquinone oxidoreductase subunit E